MGCGDDGAASSDEGGSDAAADSGADSSEGPDTAQPDAAEGDSLSDAGSEASADAQDTEDPDAEGDAGEGAPDTGDGGDADATVEPEREYQATIRRTTHGVPHVVADNWGDAGFGSGYVFAQDNFCILADQIVRANSRRARWFGPGNNDANINSDFAMLALRNREVAQETLASMRPDVLELILGYVAGYNHYLEEVGVGGLPDACKDKPWVAPISVVEYLAYLHMVSLYGSGTNLLTLIATAQPPETNKTSGGNAPPPPPLPDFTRLELGSNGWGIGEEKTETGTGMLVVNPHFPWEGERRFSELHVTVNGIYNVYGAAIMGSPIPNIGFNESLGWTHTVATSKHFTFYKISPVATDPTQYKVDGKEVAMTGTEFTIDVLGEGGAVETRSRTMYRTEYGPMINVSPFGWTAALAVSYRDANEGNMRTIAQWMDMGKATTLAEFQTAMEVNQGIPWVNTMYADKEGNAFYVDNSASPNLSQAAWDAWEAALESDFFTQQAWQSGVILLDGAKGQNRWVDDPDAAAPGIVPFKSVPKLTRKDFVCNANDSHWLTNPAAPLEGFPPVWGDEKTARSARTRMNLEMLMGQGDTADAGPDGKFNLEELRLSVLGQRGYWAENLRNEFVAACEGATTVTVGEEEVDITLACTVLAAWDGRSYSDSAGAALWREVLATYPASAQFKAGPLLAADFDVTNPVTTPSGLSAEAKPLEAIGKAVVALNKAGFSPSDPLGNLQHRVVGDTKIAIPGGTGSPEGVFNVIAVINGNNTLYPSTPIGTVITQTTGLSDQGYVVRYGSSTMMAVEFTADGPRGSALLTYSQSSNPASPYFSDQTLLFSESQWRDIRFTEADIAADPNFSELEVATQGN
jgi:acyl-homoserine-lactone acylase